jgi:tRNA A37 threonylcarbamoyladenosine modification protein TsaB
VIDARRREVFAGIYAVSSNLDERRAPHAVAPADFSKAVLALAEDAVVAVGGNGLEAYSDAFEGLVAVSLPADSSANFPKAIDLVRRVDGGEGLRARPFYCRLPDVEEKRLAREAAKE